MNVLQVFYERNRMNMIGFMSPGPLEIIVILLVVLLLFGAKRLPELARSLGKSLNEFKRGREEGDKPAEGKDKPGDEIA
jgi:sec-independent protein translocase protein TatA